MRWTSLEKGKSTVKDELRKRLFSLPTSFATSKVKYPYLKVVPIQ